MAAAPKTKKNPRDYLPWAGMFADPDRDPEVFATLPGWRQREVLYVRKATQEGRVPTLEERRRVIEGDPLRRLTLEIPPGYSLFTIQSRTHEPGPDSVVFEKVRKHITEEALLTNCTEFGDGKRLAATPPADGVFRYIWARAAYQNVQVDAFSLANYLELEEGIEAVAGAHVTLAGRSARSLLSWLDTQASLLLSLVP